MRGRRRWVPLRVRMKRPDHTLSDANGRRKGTHGVPDLTRRLQNSPDALRVHRPALTLSFRAIDVRTRCTDTRHTVSFSPWVVNLPLLFQPRHKRAQVLTKAVADTLGRRIRLLWRGSFRLEVGEGGPGRPGQRNPLLCRLMLHTRAPRIAPKVTPFRVASREPKS